MAKLQGHYNNSYEAFNGHIGRIFKQEPIRRGDVAGATKSIAMIQSSVLEANKIVKEKDTIACAAAVQLITLMDIETREQWRLRQNNTEILTLKEVSEFLLEKIKTWKEVGSGETFEGNHQIRESRRRNKEQNEFRMPVTGNAREYSAPRREFRREERFYNKPPREISCYKCQGKHFMSRCK